MDKRKDQRKEINGLNFAFTQISLGVLSPAGDCGSELEMAVFLLDHSQLYCRDIEKSDSEL